VKLHARYWLERPGILPDCPALRFRWSGHSPKVERKIRVGRFMADMFDPYHAEPVANSMKSLLCPKEKSVEYLDDALRTFGG
jgi:hypothetical protein